MSLCSSSADVSLRTMNTLSTYARVKSAAHVTCIVFATVGDSFTREDMFTGRGGRFGSGVGLFVGIGFCRATYREFC